MKGTSLISKQNIQILFLKTLKKELRIKKHDWKYSYRGLFALSNEVKSIILPSSNWALQLLNFVTATVALIINDNTINKSINCIADCLMEYSYDIFVKICFWL